MPRVAAPAASNVVAVVNRVSRRPKPVAFVETGGLRPGVATHVVRLGESLWSIADAVLGGHATPAQIGREVHRLWTLNRSRIRTGNPDLLMVGTQLVLR